MHLQALSLPRWTSRRCSATPASPACRWSPASTRSCCHFSHSPPSVHRGILSLQPTPPPRPFFAVDLAAWHQPPAHATLHWQALSRSSLRDFCCSHVSSSCALS